MGLLKHQEEALGQAYAVLGEHFDSCLILVHTEVTDKQTGSRVFWKGGFMNALGMIEWAKRRILDSAEDSQS